VALCVAVVVIAYNSGNPQVMAIVLMRLRGLAEVAEFNSMWMESF